jgi:hypothetical protein
LPVAVVSLRFTHSERAFGALAVDVERRWWTHSEDLADIERLDTELAALEQVAFPGGDYFVVEAGDDRLSRQRATTLAPTT